MELVILILDTKISLPQLETRSSLEVCESTLLNKVELDRTWVLLGLLYCFWNAGNAFGCTDTDLWQPCDFLFRCLLTLRPLNFI